VTNASEKPLSILEPGTEKKITRGRTFLFIGEIAMILILLLVWILSESVKRSKNLFVLFFYSFPSEFLIGLIPHEPVILYYGELHPPLVVALVAVVGTVMAEGINYSVFGFVADTSLFRKMSGGKLVRVIIDLFEKAPFPAILFAGFTPVPFFPVRFLVVMGRYSVFRYLLAVFLSRAPRFYILAVVGSSFRIPASVIVLLFILMIATVNVPLVRRLLRGNDAR